jgi:hypothetical protein
MHCEVSDRILALERSALDRWGAGDPGGFLELSSADVSYFDPFQEARLDGLEGLTALYDTIRGKIRITRSQSSSLAYSWPAIAPCSPTSL